MALGKGMQKKDRGNVLVACYTSGDQIVLDFQEDLSWVSFDPDGWRSVIKLLEDKIKEIEES